MIKNDGKNSNDPRGLWACINKIIGKLKRQQILKFSIDN